MQNHEEIYHNYDELKEFIRKADKAYFIDNQPIIEDYLYDKLKVALLEYEKERDIENIEVGYPVEFNKHKHRSKMLSIKTQVDTSRQAINAWLISMQRKANEQIVFIAEPKYDGLALSLIYKNGNLAVAATRGDGFEGEDVTENILLNPDIPKFIEVLKEHDLVEIRGEAILPCSSFENINQEKIKNNEKTYLNTRNAASGILRSQSQSYLNKHMSFYAYQLVDYHLFGFTKYTETIRWLKVNGFNTCPAVMECITTEDILKWFKYYEQLRIKLDYEIDGMVFKPEDLKLSILTEKDQREIPYTIALKFDPVTKETTLKDVIFQVGRTGKITPVGVLEPVQIASSWISRVTLSNEEELQRKNISLNSKVLIRKAGDVIPELIRCLNQDKELVTFPKHCPQCNTLLEKKDDSVDWYCPNTSNCPAQKHRLFIHAVDRKAFNIQNLGPKILESLLNKGKLGHVLDLFTLSKEDLIQYAGLSELMADKIYLSIQKAKEMDFHRFLFGLGIYKVGEVLCIEVASKFANLNELYNASIEDFQFLGPQAANALYNYLHYLEPLDLIEKTQSLGLKLIPYRSFKGKLTGISFAITGSFDKPRQELIEKIVENGGQYLPQISRRVNYLIAGEGGGEKRYTAKALGIKIIDDNELEFMIYPMKKTFKRN